MANMACSLSYVEFRGEKGYKIKRGTIRNVEEKKGRGKEGKRILEG
jgi:hypothetical protein